MRRRGPAAVRLGFALAPGCVAVGPGGQAIRDGTANALWSFIIPGTGQIMNGESGKGLGMMAVFLLNDLRASNDECMSADDAEWYSTVRLAVTIWSAVDAYSSAQRLNATAPFGPPAPRRGAPPPVAFALDPVGRSAAASVEWRF
jgi:hypothetical protein